VCFKKWLEFPICLILYANEVMPGKLSFILDTVLSRNLILFYIFQNVTQCHILFQSSFKYFELKV